MFRVYLLIIALTLLLSDKVFSQKNFYWIKLKDKQHSDFQISNPSEFLSQRSIDRRVKQEISIDTLDLPISKLYEDSLLPYFTDLVHRLKWFNTLVVKVEDAGYIRQTILSSTDSMIQSNNQSVVIHDTTIIHYQKTLTLSGIIDSTVYTSRRDTVFSATQHQGPVLIFDTITITDAVTGNKFDSLRSFSFVDSIGEILSILPVSGKRFSKFEDPAVVNQSYVYPNKYGRAYSQTRMLNIDLLHQLGFRGDGKIIAMMDNGYSNADNIAAYDSVRNRIYHTWDFVNNEENVYNDGGHGENTFSCIAANIPDRFLGTAPDAGFFLYTTEDDQDEWVMEEYNWAAAAEHADSAGADVFSTSLGYTEFNRDIGNHTYTDLDGDKTVITRASNIAFTRGILVVNSAGNEGANSWHYISAPADGKNVLAIGAVDSNRVIVGFSSRGPNASGAIKPDICAQGTTSGVVTVTGDIGISSGTSFSCPILAGAAASLWSAFPDKSAQEIYTTIIENADRYQKPDNDYGYGIPNFYNAYLKLATDNNTNILKVNGQTAIFPNPFSDQLNVTVLADSDKEYLIEIFDMLGRKVISQKTFVRKNTFEIISLQSIASLLPGKYVVRLDGNKKTSQSLVKVK